MNLRRGERGATMVEAALTLPFLLFGTLFFVWIAVSKNEEATFDAALGSAMRLAATRGDPFLLAPFGTSSSLPAVDNWKSGGGGGPFNPSIEDLMTHDVDWGSIGESYYDSYSLGAFASIVPNLKDLPLQYLYTLVYINESMRLGVGNSLRYPCDPTQFSGAGCLDCKFLAPDASALSYADYCSAHPGCQCAVGGFCPIPIDAIAIECRYRPANFLLGPLIGMIRILAGSYGDSLLVMRRTRVFNFSTGKTS